MMPIAIENVRVQNYGPISKFSSDFSLINLIYGANEQGKTALVEFLIRSLFRQTAKWNLRSFEGAGKVVIRGLEENPTTFSPDSDLKLEDYLDEKLPGLPPDFSRLFVVKGAEVEMANVIGGIDKEVITRLLSNKGVLDDIQSRISPTIRDSRVEGNKVVGPRRGEITAMEQLEEELGDIDRLFSQLNLYYSAGERQALENEKQSLEIAIEEMVNAKRFLAYTVAREISRVREKRARISSEKIQEGKSNYLLFRQKELEHNRKCEEQKEAADKSKHYEWLLNARDIYETVLQSETKKPRQVFLVLTLLCLVAAGATLWFAAPLYTGLSLVGIMVFGVIHLRFYHMELKEAGKSEELEQLRDEFQMRFDKKLNGLSVLVEMQRTMEQDYNTASLLARQGNEELLQIQTLKLKLSNTIYQLVGERKEPGTWDEVIRVSENDSNRLDERIREREVYLARLGIDESDYQRSPSGVIFSQNHLDELLSGSREIEAKADDEQKKLQNLKHIICQETGDDISADWNQLIENLQNKRDRIFGEHRDKTAEILGKIAVSRVVDEMRYEEDQKIITKFETKEIQEPLYQLTSRYESIKLNDQALIVSDKYNDYALSGLSTGAQEQVLLALRIGFAQKLLRSETLFLILDDAFQYSDWQRRNLLVRKMTQLAKSGWQIIYFTMDDHIRDLFDAEGKSFQDYKSISLN